MPPSRFIVALATSAAFAIPLAVGSTTLPEAHAAGRVAVQDGGTPETAVFPNDKFTVVDSRQLSDRRINLPIPSCSRANYSICDGLRLLNQIDGSTCSRGSRSHSPGRSSSTA